VLAVIKISVLLGSKRCRTNKSRAPLLQGVAVIAATLTVLKFFDLKGCSETVLETSVFYFFLVLLMANGSDLNQTDRFRRSELPNFSDQVEEIPEPACSGFVKLRNTVRKNHFLMR